MPTISDLRKAGHSVAKLAMSSLFLYAAGTIARSTGAAMKPPGGEMPVSIQPLRPARLARKPSSCQSFTKNPRRAVKRTYSRNRSYRQIFEIILIGEIIANLHAPARFRPRIERVKQGWPNSPDEWLTCFANVDFEVYERRRATMG
jgi:hypothetical protein